MAARTTKKSLTPAELFDYRLASLLGYADIDEMKRSMTQRSYLGWQRYWDVEPWGPWRDNIHAAIVAREVRRTRSRPNARLGLDPYMVKNPEARRKEGEQNFFGVLQAVATAVTPAEAEARRKKAKRTRRRRK